MIDNNLCDHKSKVLQNVEFWQKKTYNYIEGWNSGGRGLIVRTSGVQKIVITGFFL